LEQDLKGLTPSEKSHYETLIARGESLKKALYWTQVEFGKLPPEEIERLERAYKGIRESILGEVERMYRNHPEELRKSREQVDAIAFWRKPKK
jgi:hypothetical protein